MAQDNVNKGPVFGPSGPARSSGFVPAPAATAGATQFLREDATWAVPPAGGSAVFMVALVKITSSKAVGTGTTATPWDAVEYDTNSFWSAANPTRLTVPAGVTRVRLVGCVEFGTGASGNRYVRIFKNGAIAIGTGAFGDVIGSTDPGWTLSSAVLSVVAGDYFELVPATGVASQSVIATNNRTWFAIEAVAVPAVEARSLPTGPSPETCEGRLSLSSTLPVTTADTQGTTLYWLPYVGDQIALWDGTAWVNVAVPPAGISLALGVLPATNHDVFASKSGTNMILDLEQWSGDNTRAVVLVRQNGVLVRGGTPARRYVGTIRFQTLPGVTDTRKQRFLWNYYNRVDRPLFVTDASVSWTYATQAYRMANGDPNNSFEYVQGWSEDPLAVMARTHVNVANSASGHAGIGLDQSTSDDADFFGEVLATTTGVVAATPTSQYCGFPSVGYHRVNWLEYRRTGTVTFFGSGATTQASPGMSGIIKG